MTLQSDGVAIPVTVLTGFLGSGKTTVLNYLLRQPELSGVVAIINEFGEVGLDHLLVETSEERFVLLDNGCICCSVRDDLIQTLNDLKRRRIEGSIPPYHRILIETTGLADPVPVLHTLMTSPDIIPNYRIDGVAVTVDAVNGMRTLTAHAEAVKQVAVADRILLTKVDIAEEVQVAELRSALWAINPTATLSMTQNGNVPASNVLESGMFDPAAKSSDVVGWFQTASAAAETTAHDHYCVDARCDHPRHHGHDANHAGISSFSLTVAEPVRWAAFAQWLDYVALLKGEDLLRFKGLVNVADRPNGPVVVHGVQHVFHPPIELTSWPSADRRTRLVFIVKNIPCEVIERTLSKFAGISQDAIHRTAA